MTATILTFPTHRTVQLLNLNGQVVFSAGFPTNVRDPGAPWAWIVETVTQELEVDEDAVGCAESDDGDMVTVEGLPVYRVEILRAHLLSC